MTTIFLTTTGAGSQARPADWQDSGASCEVIGGGGGGSGGTLVTQGGGGGGGGYSKLTAFTMAATIFYSIGTGGNAGAAGGNGTAGADTWIRIDGTNSAPTTTAQGTLAKAGGPGTTGPGGGAGGAAASGVGTVTHSGGAGAAGSNSGAGGPGGGGAGGPQGNGGSAVADTGGSFGGTGGGGSGGGGSGTNGANGVTNSTVNGGAGGNNAAGAGSGGGGTGGASPTAGTAGTVGGGGGGGGGSTGSATGGKGGNGGPGQDWDATHGAGGGGGGGGGIGATGTGGAGGTGGNYGGGGGAGAGGSTNGVGGAGAQGIGVIIYTPTGGGSTPTWGWSSRREDERPKAAAKTEQEATFFRSPSSFPPILRPTVGTDQGRQQIVPDRYRPGLVPQVPAAAALVAYMAQTNADDFNPLSPFRFEEQSRAFAPKPPAAQVNTISGIAWWRPADDARLVSGRGIRAPDEAFPWFVRSPNPVPNIWLAETGADRERPPPIGRPPDEPGTYYRSRAAILPTWLPETGADRERLPPFGRPGTIAFSFKAPPPPVGIAGMAWHNPSGPDGKEYPGVTDEQWQAAWAPQIIIQITPPPVTQHTGGAAYVIRFTRKRYEEWREQLEKERKALQKSADEAKPERRKILQKALRVSGLLSDALGDAGDGPEIDHAAEVHRTNVAALSAARTRAATAAQAAILIAHVERILAELEEEELSTLLLLN